MILRLVSLLCLLVPLLPRPAVAQEAVRPVLLLHPPGADGDRYTDDLVPAVAARLLAMPVSVEGVAVTGAIGEAEARAVAADRGAWTVAWLSPEGDALWLLSPTLSTPAHTRAVGDTGPSWVARCEAIASMLHAELAVLLVQAPPWTPDEPASDEPESDVVPEEPVLAAEEPAEPVEAPEGPPPPRLVVRLGYTPVPLSVDGPVLHGLDLGVGARLLPWVGFDLGVSITNPIPLGADGGIGSLLRVPVRASAVGSLPLGRFEPSVALGVVLEVLQVQGLAFTPEDGSSLAPVVTPGFTAEVRAAAVPLPWLRPYLAVGIDALAREQDVVLHDTVVARRDAALLRASVGVTVLLPPGTP